MIAALLASVLVASLLGSLHCAAMCGPFVAVWVVGESKRCTRSQQVGTRASYHLGRLFVYASLGGIAGALGSGVDNLGRFAGMSRLAAVVAGVLVLVSGLGLVVPRLALPRFGARLMQPHASKLVQLRTKSQVVRAGLLGGLTPLLPCGWLYAFVLTAAGTGSAAYGALVMATFWVGTVPALLGMDAVLANVGVHIRKRVPLISGLTLIALGLFTIGRRLEIHLPTRSETAQDVHAAAAVPGPHHKCH